MAVKFNPLEGGRTVKAEILVFVLPVVIIGLLVRPLRNSWNPVP